MWWLGPSWVPQWGQGGGEGAKEFQSVVSHYMGSAVADFMNEVLLCLVPQMLNNLKQTTVFCPKRLLKRLTLSCLCAKSILDHLHINVHYLLEILCFPFVFLTHRRTDTHTEAFTV